VSSVKDKVDRVSKKVPGFCRCKKGEKKKKGKKKKMLKALG